MQLDGIDFEKILKRASAIFGLPGEEVLSPGKRKIQSKARSVVCFWATRELGMTATALARKLALSQPAVSKAAIRGEQIVKEEGLTLRNREAKL
jgi:hypothetical protein